jgi:glutamate-1-semialdehyde 2,1-aminomutase
VATEKLIHKHAKDLAAIIVEPVAGNMGVVPPIDEFLPWLRMITQKYEIVLIFDEVITGFRVQYGGAQARFKVIPDLTCLGKIIGGGLPIGAYGGRKDMMQMIAPAGPVYQAGTLSGNPVAVAAGIETIRQLKKPGVYKELERKSEMVAEGLGEAARAEKIPYYQTRVGSMLGGFFAEGPVTDYASAKKSDTAKFGKFFHGMLNQGIYLAPSQFEAMLLSTAHSTSQIRHTVSAARQAFKML